MTLTPVEKLPKTNRTSYKKCADIIKEFMKMNVTYAKFEFTENEYTSAFAAITSLRYYVRNHTVPVIVKIINGELYLIRKDLEEA